MPIDDKVSVWEIKRADEHGVTAGGKLVGRAANRQNTLVTKSRDKTRRRDAHRRPVTISQDLFVLQY